MDFKSYTDQQRGIQAQKRCHSYFESVIAVMHFPFWHLIAFAGTGRYGCYIQLLRAAHHTSSGFRQMAQYAPHSPGVPVR